MKWGQGVNIGWGTLSYGVKVEGRGEVGGGGGGRSEHCVGYPTVPYPTLRSSSGLLN